MLYFFSCKWYTLQDIIPWGSAMKKCLSFVREYFLFLLIAAQPLLDAVAYWLQSDEGTIAGKIRLAFMVLLPLYLLVKLQRKKHFILSMAIMGLYSLLHILNGLRVGYLDPYFDIAYLVRVLYMPVMAICFVYLVINKSTRDKTVKGIVLAAGLTLLSFVLACLTGTDNVTYAEGMGISGWVIDDNRCANSIILVSLSCFALLYGIGSKKWYINVLIPVACAFLLIINGTKACYFGLLGCLFSYLVFLLLEKPILGRKIRRVSALTLALVLITSIVIYPITPRAKAAADRASAPNARSGEIEATAAALGYDVPSMTPEERFNTPEVKEIFAHYYVQYMAAIPDLFDRFGMDAVLQHFNMSTNVAKLIDTREIKLCYSALIWADCDLLTRLVGFEVTEIGTEGIRDLENDWPAIFYYYGYLGFALYAAFVLWFLFLVAKRLLQNFKGSFTALNFCLLLCVVLQIGLAQFSGAILRMPNVSIYMAAVLALIYYQTRREPLAAKGEKPLEA